MSGPFSNRSILLRLVGCLRFVGANDIAKNPARRGQAACRHRPKAIQLRYRLTRAIDLSLRPDSGAARVAQTPSPIISAIDMVDIAILFWNVMSARPKQKLFPHFSEARTVIFVIEIVE
jgi:hypothetical protein